MFTKLPVFKAARHLSTLAEAPCNRISFYFPTVLQVRQ